MVVNCKLKHCKRKHMNETSCQLFDCCSKKMKNIAENDVLILFEYFQNKNYVIQIEHIYSALRRNCGHLNKARDDLSQLLLNQRYEIRTFLDSSTLTDKIIISNQKWQINPQQSLYLLYNNSTVYKIADVYPEYIVLDRVITHQKSFITCRFTDNDVRFGCYKDVDDIYPYLEKEYQIICDQFDNISKQHLAFLNKCFVKKREYTLSLEKIQLFHENNCTLNAKIYIVGKLDLPIHIISHIISFNIESICNHIYDIKMLQKSLNKIEYQIDIDFPQYNELLVKKKIAYHVLYGKESTKSKR